MISSWMRAAVAVLVLALLAAPALGSQTVDRYKKHNLLASAQAGSRNATAASDSDWQLTEDEKRAGVDIDALFPKLQGTCPDGARTERLDSENLGERVTYCGEMLRKANASSDCLIYNFGVAKEDPTLAQLARTYSHCSVFAFDPTVDESVWAAKGGVKSVFGHNVEFKNWGLAGADSTGKKWSHPVYGDAAGTLYTLKVIMSKLGHTGRSIAYMRSDCEGCEWGWISTQMEEDPSMFTHIDQMYFEVHFASTLRFDRKAASQMPALDKMMADNFRVIDSRVHNGGEADQNKVPAALVKAGVDGKGCCREFAAVNVKAFEKRP